MTSSPHSLPAADGIRGVACLIVLWMHGLSLGWPERLFPLLKGGGKYGVWLFFVLSAFLLTLRLQRRGFGLTSLADYALARSLRIVPLFVLACLLYAWTGVGIADARQLGEVLSLQRGSIHLWTIPVEFKAYVVLPLMAWLGLRVQRYAGNAGLLLAALLALLVQQVLWPYWQTPADSPDTRWYLPAFLFGSLAALLLPWTRQWRRGTVGSVCALLTLLILLVALPGVRQALLGGPLANDLMDKHLFLGLGWALFVLLLVDGEGLAGRLLSSRLLGFVGRISYSTYLFHWLIMVGLFHWFPQSVTAFAAALALALLAGALGYYLAELPLERLRQRLTPSTRRPTATSPSAAQRE
ncbi:acyltransferase family protein [Stutzerimonas nitrititolerans]|uniref:acyltransferase family protein n=1 Tax=Stutzerimonas nitrititolerans TaxID=2482751 RepID=UPI002899ED7A|nr:acyltransferase [Stutzerimonas nitrititolerans]